MYYDSRSGVYFLQLRLSHWSPVLGKAAAGTIRDVEVVIVFPDPSTAHRRELLALRLVVYWRFLRTYLSRHRNAVIVLAGIGLVVLVGIHYWHSWITTIPAELADLAKATLAFVRAHPRLSHTFHVLVDMVPDIAYLLLALAGVSYLMPEFVDKIDKSKMLRIAVFTLFICFGLLAIIVNEVSRADHVEKEAQLGERMRVVGESVNNVQKSLQRTPNAAERKRQIFETLRDQYTIEHPDVPITMLTGNSWPPKPWMDQRLKELGERFQFIPPESVPPLQVVQQPQAPPPAIDLTVVVSDKNDDASQVVYAYKPGMSYIQRERACLSDFKCYPERDFASIPINIKIGDKGWARVFFRSV